MKNHSTLIILMILMLLFGADPAWCKKKGEESSGHFYLSPTYGGYLLDKPRGAQDDIFYGIKFGYEFVGAAIPRSMGLEGFVSRAKVDTDPQTDKTTVYQFRVDTIHPLLKKKKLIPFLAAGGGWVHVDGDADEAEGGAIVGLGFGVSYAVTNYLQLRTDLRKMIWFEPDQRNYFEGSVGLTYLFGQERPKKPVPPPDTDRDGVEDARDRCPETPSGIAVDADGCRTDNEDSDGDGVPDYADECNATAAGIEVNEVGCPLDSDGDGIPDFLDRCPGTPAGVETNLDGCVGITTGAAAGAEQAIPSGSLNASSSDAVPAAVPPVAVVTLPAVAAPGAALDGSGVVVEEQTLPQPPASVIPPAPLATALPIDSGVSDKNAPEVIENVADTAVTSITVDVQFDFDRADISDEYFAGLQRIVMGLLASQPRKVIVAGYTDSMGSAAYNNRLSKQRAESVKNYIVTQGVDPDLIQTVGYGERWPIADNSTEQGRQKNRRVMIYFMPRR